MNPEKYPDLQETLKNNPELAKALGKTEDTQKGNNDVNIDNEFNDDFKNEVVNLLRQQIKLQESISNNVKFFFWITFLSIVFSVIIYLISANDIAVVH